MTAIAVLNIIVGSLMILTGLFRLFGSCVLVYELLKFDAFGMSALFQLVVPRFAFAFLVLATGIAGVIAGKVIFRLRHWARTLSLVFAALLIASAVSSYFIVPIIATIGTYNISSIDIFGLVRLIIFSTIYVILPVTYCIVLWIVFHKPTWRHTFAKGGTA
jgi:hypothetical protein